MKPGMTHRVPAFGAVAALLLAAGALPAEGGKGAASWRQFHGPRRDNISPETSLRKQWPKDGPPLAWTFSQCGSGYAGVSIAAGRIFTSGDFAQQEMVMALDLGGKLLWKVPNGRSWRGAMPGARTTPTYHEGVLYHLNPTGRLAALQSADGKEIWSVDLRKTYGARYGRWAMSENVVIDGNLLLCVPGGTKGAVVALDKTTGAGVWANTEIAEPAAYCSPLVVTHNGVRQMITIVQKSVVSVEVRTGKLLWRHDHPTKHDQNVTMPIYRDGLVYTSSGHGTGGTLLRLAPDSRSVRQVWTAKDLDNCHGGVILRDGCVYGSGCRLFRKGFVCVDFRTGKTLWNEPKLGKVSLAWADGRFYCLSDRGRMSLVEATPRTCRVVSQFRLPSASRQLTLSHPVICGGRLYVRHWSDLFVYDVRASAAE